MKVDNKPKPVGYKHSIAPYSVICIGQYGFIVYSTPPSIMAMHFIREGAEPETAPVHTHLHA